MKHGYFDNQNREYVIDKVDVPVSWTNYLGVKDLCGVINHTAGGYLFNKTPEYKRITRFRANGTPMDRPGRYVYIRDDDTGEFWSLSWQPVGLPLDKAKYTCRHGLSYSKYQCSYSGIDGEQTLFIPIDDSAELWDVKLKNTSGKKRNLSVFAYCEFSFHQIRFDNQNFQTSLYCQGSDYDDGVIEVDWFYESGPDSFAYFTSNETPDSFDSSRDVFLGVYNTESNPKAVLAGKCSGSKELGGNHCGAFQKKVCLDADADFRIVFMLGVGDRNAGKDMRKKYSNMEAVNNAFSGLAKYWNEKLSQLQIDTPSEAMNTMVNIWTLYQSEINVMFSRFASFIEVGGRTGLGYRDTAQDAMTIPHSNPEKCRSRIVELLRGLMSQGYGLHLFQPEWFEKEPDPTALKNKVLHGVEQACADDALWLVTSIAEYIRETGEIDFIDEIITYADGGEGTVYEHMTKILDFSTEQVGINGICKGLHADWNDCINLRGGESAMVSFLHHWALEHFIALAKRVGRGKDAEKYAAIAEQVREVSERVLWDDGWYARGITEANKKIGVHADAEGKVHMESNTWAVLSGVASYERGIKAMDAVDEYLYMPWGLLLCAPAYSVVDDSIGFVTRVYKGLKENAAIFSHPNPWAWCAEAILGRGNRAMKFYDAICPYNQNDKIEIRESEPYSYCQFIVGTDHEAYGRARHPFMTGSGGWSYFAATRYILGIRPDFDGLVIDPCISSDWKGFKATRKWRGATYEIEVQNPNGVEKGVKDLYVDGKEIDGNKVPVAEKGAVCKVRAVMG